MILSIVRQTGKSLFLYYLISQLLLIPKIIISSSKGLIFYCLIKYRPRLWSDPTTIYQINTNLYSQKFLLNYSRNKNISWLTSAKVFFLLLCGRHYISCFFSFFINSVGIIISAYIIITLGLFPKVQP